MSETHINAELPTGSGLVIPQFLFSNKTFANRIKTHHYMRNVLMLQCFKVHTIVGKSKSLNRFHLDTLFTAKGHFSVLVDF